MPRKKVSVEIKLDVKSGDVVIGEACLKEDGTAIILINNLEFVNKLDLMFRIGLLDGFSIMPIATKQKEIKNGDKKAKARGGLVQAECVLERGEGARTSRAATRPRASKVSPDRGGTPGKAAKPKRQS